MQTNAQDQRQPDTQSGLSVTDWLADARVAIETARKFADQHEERIKRETAQTTLFT